MPNKSILTKPFSITEWEKRETETLNKIKEIINKNINLITETTSKNIKAVSSFIPDIKEIKEFYKKIRNEWIKEENIETSISKINKIKKFWFQLLWNQVDAWRYNEKDVLSFMESMDENNINTAFKSFKKITQWKYNEEVYKKFSKEAKIDNILNQLFFINKHSEIKCKIDTETLKRVSESEISLHNKYFFLINELLLNKWNEKIEKNRGLLTILKNSIEKWDILKAYNTSIQILQWELKPIIDKSETNLNTKNKNDIIISLIWNIQKIETILTKNF